MPVIAFARISVRSTTFIAENVAASALQFVAAFASLDPELALGTLLVLVLLSELDELVIGLQVHVVDHFGRARDFDSFVLPEDAFDPVFLWDELIFLRCDSCILVAGVVSVEELFTC